VCYPFSRLVTNDGAVTLDLFSRDILFFAGEFVERQKVVERALCELRPDWLVPRAETSAVRLTKKQRAGRAQGHWGPQAEWRYFVHGRGCKLLHEDSLEPIEWDSPDIARFNPDWFVAWLVWALSHDGDPSPERSARLSAVNRYGAVTQVLSKNCGGPSFASENFAALRREWPTTRQFRTGFQPPFERSVRAALHSLAANGFLKFYPHAVNSYAVMNVDAEPVLAGASPE
jgi:hypothetical protein